MPTIVCMVSIDLWKLNQSRSEPTVAIEVTEVKRKKFPRV